MKNIQPLVRKALPHGLVLLFFFILVFIYFYPSFNGKIIQQSDVTKFYGMAQELSDFGEPSGWLGSMFSGMPSYQVTGYSEGINFMEKIKTFFMYFLHFESSGPIFFMLICSYILFLVLGVNFYLAVLGSVAIAFSSYNIIILDAGHITKAWTLAYVPLVLAGMYSVFKRKYVLGFFLFLLGLYLNVTMNHFQITYYVGIACSIVFVAFLVFCIRQKDYKHIAITTGIFFVAVIGVVLTNIVNLYATSELAKESIRGVSEVATDGEKGQKPVSGLDKDYVFAWSYGKAETFTLLIPNVMGGVTKPFGENSEIYKTLVENVQRGQLDPGNANQLLRYAREYWGDQPFTSGPVYFGAIVCLLFLFSFFIIRSRWKWVLLGITVFFIVLAWGRNLAWFNDFMYYYFPYYNKFRSVSTALVIPGFIFPIMAVLGLKELFEGKLSREKLKKSLVVSTGITGGFCLLFWLIPGIFFSFLSPAELQSGLPDWFLQPLEEDRKSLLKADAFRSLLFIILGAGLISLYIKPLKKNITVFVSLAFIVLVLVDLWQVDKRYLNYDNFISKKNYQQQTFKKSVANEEILKDKSPSYRVLNLDNPFQETFTSYFHKSIGGYHAAKLQRYQDLIDARLSEEIRMIINVFNSDPTQESILNVLSQCTSLNMLNTKYIIYNPSQPPIYNPYHYGTAWFVSSYDLVDNAREELAALNTIRPYDEAVLDKSFASSLEGLQIIPDSTAVIEMISYAPNKVVYKSSSKQDGLAIFSEIYYKYGWKAYVDGEKIPISRADWTLRALVIPAGEHTVEMVFENDGIRITSLVATISSILLILLFIGFIVYYLFFRKRKNKQVIVNEKIS